MASGETFVRRFLSRGPEATEALGEALGRLAQGGWLLCLEGDLGAGKTCLVRGLARGLGVEVAVTSPSFALMNTYPGRLELLHCDAWMEGRERAFLADGGAETLGPGTVCAVEWGERVVDGLPGDPLVVRLDHAGPELREVELRAPAGGAMAAALETLETPPGLEEA